jgi:Acetyltransferase (GNAT) domain
LLMRFPAPSSAQVLRPTLTAEAPTAQVWLPGGRYSLALALGLEAAQSAESQFPHLAFSPILFHTVGHARTQPGSSGLIWTALIDQFTGRRVGQWLIWPDPTQPGHARSPGLAPFAGPQAAESVPTEVLTEWIAITTKVLADLGYRHLLLRLPPDCYAPTALPRLVTALGKAGAVVSERESLISHHLRIHGVEGFARGLAPPTLRRWRRLRATGHQVSEEPLAALPALIDHLTDWRQLRGHSLSLSADTLTRLVHAFPAELKLFSVRTPAAERVAVAIAIWVTPDILYYFLPASNPVYDSWSPSILLLSGLYDACLAAGGKLLDLGPSLTTSHAPNASLARFKQHVGGVASLRLTLHLPLGIT